MSPLKVECFLQLVTEKDIRDSNYLKDLMHHCRLKMEEAIGKA